ncbi:plant UBX domain-containing protein 10-like [Coffea eugenioides]|uniref:plant UBX domain-containing protein 10-like n=1 Tax=Coffea eugenioides TaxID=49369 RepID=UPI000F60D24C|nr:plant UBX domain-containing protein 10-like [Coffea eugenioides]
MSSMMRGNSRSSIESSCNGIVRRMVSLPRSILGGVSRAMGQGMDFIRIGGRRHHPHQHHHLPLATDFPFEQYPSSDPPVNDPFNQPSQNFQQQPMVQEEWAFLASLEQEYGTNHPFFYVCRFMDALKMAQEEHKFIFLYLHSPEHQFTPFFCRETLGSELVVQFLDANFISWGALANRGEGFHLASTLRVSNFPFCAVVAPASAGNLAVLRQIEGPVSPAELVEILQRTMEEQGLAFDSARANEEEKRRADRKLREEQDVAYVTALQRDQEKEKLRSFASEQRVSKAASASNSSNQEKTKPLPLKQQNNQIKDGPRAGGAMHKGNAQETKILIRFPNGERREHSFLSTDKVQAIFRYINSLGLPGVGGNYRLISNFPRKVFSVDQMGMTLTEAGLHPKASMFLELL